jgi:hypothetical protein
MTAKGREEVVSLQVHQQRHRPISSKHSHRRQIIIIILIPSLRHVHPTSKQKTPLVSTVLRTRTFASEIGEVLNIDSPRNQYPQQKSCEQDVHEYCHFRRTWSAADGDDLE